MINFSTYFSNFNVLTIWTTHLFKNTAPTELKNMKQPGDAWKCVKFT